jgi:hypothetical protein
MTRYLLIRGEDDVERVVPETPLPLEANLHDALTKHPELLPADDLGLGRTVVVGRETSLESGRADLVLLDEWGSVCLVEVKKEGNPDTRRVVAQLLDYAAALWGMSLEEFERDVLLRFMQTTDGSGITSLHAFLVAAFGVETSDSSEVGEHALDRISEIEDSLAANLRSGRFRLVVAAPTIPDDVGRILDYLNAQGLNLYGLEVSYFKGPSECFVPRLAIRPAAPGQPKHDPRPRLVDSPASFLEQLRSNGRDAEAKVVGELFTWAERLGLRSRYGTGWKWGSWYVLQQDDQGELTLFIAWTDGSIQVPFGAMASKHPAFNNAEKRLALLKRLDEIPGISIDPDKIDKWPNMPISALIDPNALHSFTTAMEWALGEMQG